MLFKEFTLKSHLPEQISTEIMYEIASARADNAELVRINILCDDSTAIEKIKLFSWVLKILKQMKSNSKIQFFATEDSFKLSKTEAIFLQNKYPDYFTENSVKGDFFYIKL